MKYTIYKLSGKFATHRWWRNYDANNKNLPDIDIETYISNKSLTWTPLLNTRGEKASYETINRDNLDEIEIYIDDINNVPDYLKITFTKADTTTESVYYYVDRQPSIYNAKEKLASKVRYIIDKYASFMFKFHNHFVNNNPNMFFVRKHTNRFKKSVETNKWYFDMNTQPWLNFNNEEYKLYVKNKQVITSNIAMNLAVEHLNTIDERYEFKYDTLETDYGNIKALFWKERTASEWKHHFAVGYYTNEEQESITERYINISDDMFNNSGMYKYVITKPQGFDYGNQGYNHKIVASNKFWLWPIENKNDNVSYDALGYAWGRENTLSKMVEFATLPFASDNIIELVITTISPIAILLLSTKNVLVRQIEDEDVMVIGNAMRFLRQVSEPVVAYYHYDLFETSSHNPVVNQIIKNNVYITSIQDMLTDVNNGIVLKDKKHNPHLYSPSNYRLTYRASTNNESILTSDYIDLSKYETLELSYNSIISPEWASRLLVNHWNNNKALSQTANELTTNEVRQAPISSTAYNNTYLQRQILDTGRNNLMKSSAGNIGTSALSVGLGLILTATGYGSGLGAIGLIAGLGGLTASGINLSNGLAQNEAQKRALLLQSDTLNNATNTNGLSPFGTWAEEGLLFYTESISDFDSNKINADDNMYGYYQNTWLPYNDYLNCWDGNYMLCDISRNYNTLFQSLKSINSIFTINDNYINEFLNALNNGVTWFANGEYKDLATDVNNYERVFPQANKK